MTSVSGTAEAPPRLEGAAPSGTGWNVRAVRARLRLVSALVLLSFVVCHLVSHITLLISFPVANRVLTTLMEPWRSGPGTAILLTAAFVHYANALWSIYERRYLRLSAWEWWQLGLGLCIPPLLMVHVLATRVAGELLNVDSDYIEILVLQWVVTPKYVFIQSAALLTVWTHAAIGIHFWLRTKSWYPSLRGALAGVAILIPALALAGYVSAGNQIVREAEEPGYVASVLKDANLTPADSRTIYRWAYLGFASHFALVGLTFAAVWGRRFAYRMRRPPMLTHSSGRTMPILARPCSKPCARTASRTPRCAGAGRAAPPAGSWSPAGLPHFPPRPCWKRKPWLASRRRPACGLPAKSGRPPISPSCRCSRRMRRRRRAACAAGSKAASG
jgi:hypothetical protein